jgi:hypothetical protein
MVPIHGSLPKRVSGSPEGWLTWPPKLKSSSLVSSLTPSSDRTCGHGNPCYEEGHPAGAGFTFDEPERQRNTSFPCSTWILDQHVLYSCWTPLLRGSSQALDNRLWG